MATPGLLPPNWPLRLAIFLLSYVVLAYIAWPCVAVLRETFLTDPGALEGGRRAFTWDHWRAALEPSNLRALRNSIGLSLVSTALAGLVGGALAVLYTRWEFPGRRLFAAFAILPLTLPPLVGVFAFWRLFNEFGLIPRLLHAATGWSWHIETGWAGVYLVHAYSFSVYFYLLLSAALGNLDASLFEAARNLGASRPRTFFRVALPQLTPALVGASILVFMSSMASFTAPWIYIGGRDTLTVNIVNARNGQPPHQGQAALLCLFMTASSFALLLLLMWWNNRTKHYSAGKGLGAKPRRVASHGTRRLLGGTAALVSLLLASPHLYLAFESFIQQGAWFDELFPPSYTLENYALIFQDPDFLRPIWVSLKASGAATLGVSIIGLLAAWLAVRRPFRGRGLIVVLVMLPWALPGTVIAINLLEAFSGPSALTFGVGLYGTTSILALAYFIRYLPLAYRSTLASLEAMDPALEQAARNLGASRTRTLLRVMLPLAAPGILAGALLTFVTAMGEFVSSILLAVSDTMPIAVKIHDLLRFRYGVAAAYSVLLMLIILVTLAMFSRFQRSGAVRV